MSKPRFDWWVNAVNMVKNYPARKRQWEQLHSPSMQIDYSGMPKSLQVSRPAENLALRQMPEMLQREYDAVTRAVEITKLLPLGEQRIELIKRMYWSGKKLPIDAVIYQIGIGEATGKRWHARFIRLVGECVGYLDEN